MARIGSGARRTELNGVKRTVCSHPGNTSQMRNTSNFQLLEGQKKNFLLVLDLIFCAGGVL